MRFAPEILGRLRAIRTPRIETRRAPDAPVHRTPIWVIVDDADRVLIRTVRGTTSRWYREALAQPDCVLWLGKESVAVHVEPANDPERIAAASRGYETKYAGDPAVRSMVADRVLPTTLELKPR
jgi:hypothetical protein